MWCALLPLRLWVTLVLVVACRTDEDPSRNETAPEQPSESARWEGETTGGGFGSRLAVVSGAAYTSAPFAGEVWALREGTTASLLYPFGAGTFAGSGLAIDGTGELLVGAPMLGEGLVRTGTSIAVATGDRVGGVVATSPTAWVASTQSGWVLSNGQSKLLDRRPDALALDSLGRVVAGSNWGQTALWIGDTPVLRPQAEDEAGAAVVQCPGWDAMIVGAPGAGTVYSVDSSGIWTELSGRNVGRFGASLACGPETESERSIVIGAPHDGQDHQGAVYVWSESSGGLDLIAVGEAGDELGTSVAYDGESVWAGGPGGGASLGVVVRVLR